MVMTARCLVGMEYLLCITLYYHYDNTKKPWVARTAAACLVQSGTAKKPISCLEYIIVHELVHLLERNHPERFTALMETHIPKWRLYREMLNKTALGHEDWEY